MHKIAEKALELLDNLPPEMVADTIINTIISITLKPNQYKICDNCEQILNKKQAICWCGQYKFIEGKKDLDATMDEVVTEPPELVEFLHWLREGRDRKI